MVRVYGKLAKLLKAALRQLWLGEAGSHTAKPTITLAPNCNVGPEEFSCAFGTSKACP